jgi:uracil-DNA glycosylase
MGYTKALSNVGRIHLDRQLWDIVADLKVYVEYLKGMGVQSVPVSEKMPESTAKPTLTLNELRTDLGECRRCKLHRTRKTIVFGEGNDRARLMFVGEGPGYDEDVQGRPFVGRAGQLLTKIIESMKLERNAVYITNIVKCRPPGNRNPESDEISACSPFLFRQIEAIGPTLVCALGTFSAQTLLKTTAKISALRGNIYDLNGVRVIPTFHPAYLLRNPEKKKETWQDMKRIMELLEK